MLLYRSAALVFGLALSLQAWPALSAQTNVIFRYDAARGAMRTANGRYIPLTGLVAGMLDRRHSQGFAFAQPLNAVSGIVGPFSANEPAIASDPTSAKHLIGSANDYRLGEDTDGGLYATFNGGSSWRDNVVQYVVSGPLYYDADGDPAVGVDKLGDDFYSSLAFNRSGPSGGSPASAAIVARSHPNVSDAFVDATPVRVNAAIDQYFDDKDALAVDDGTAGSFRNSVYSTFTLFGPNTSPIMEAYSRDHGVSFSSIVVASAPGGTKLCPGGTTAGACADDSGSSVGVGAAGAVWVAYENFDSSGSNQILISKSTNGGAAFGPPSKVADDHDIANPFKTFRVNSFPNLAAAAGGRLYVVWADAGAGFPQILIATSSNGTSWTAPKVVATDAGANFHFFPAVAVQQTTGDVYVSWYSNGHHAGQDIYDYFYRKFSAALSPLTGETAVSAATPISPCPTGVEFGCSFFGDYTGMAANSAGGYPIWTDTRTGQEEIESKPVP
ncbi:MAG: hypothetical protein GIX02_08285 [Candidatus Eremiobacteraeota bacterium]|nr:hypothetical protein [Candidatus Eremiobacteraeota bacterium]